MILLGAPGFLLAKVLQTQEPDGYCFSADYPVGRLLTRSEVYPREPLLSRGKRRPGDTVRLILSFFRLPAAHPNASPCPAKIRKPQDAGPESCLGTSSYPRTRRNLQSFLAGLPSSTYQDVTKSTTQATAAKSLSELPVDGSFWAVDARCPAHVSPFFSASACSCLQL